MILWAFHTLLLFLLCSSPSPLHFVFLLPPTVWLWFCLRLRWSPSSSPKCPYMLFTHQVRGWSLGVWEVLFSFSCPTNHGCCLYGQAKSWSAKGVGKYFFLLKTSWQQEEPTNWSLRELQQDLQDHSGAGFTSSTSSLRTEGKDYLSCAKLSKSRGRIEGSVQLWRHVLFNENMSTQQHYCRCGGESPELFSSV